MEPTCIKCGSTACVKDGFLHGKQRYKCKACCYQFTKMTPRGRPERDKILALLFYLSGLSMQMTGKIIGVSTQTIMRWVKDGYYKYAKEHEELLKKVKFEEIEIDEMHHFIIKKNNQFGYGKLLTIQVELSSGGYVVIAVPKPS